MLRRLTLTLATPLALSLSSPLALAQNPPPEELALRACVGLAERGQADSAAAVGKTAEAIYRKRIARSARDVDALVGLGRTLAQCLLPAADFMGQGALSSEAMETLDNALDLQPTNWTARFILASIAYRSPAFLGRGDVAARHFDELLRQQGNRANEPTYARVYELRGMQLMRAGKRDSARALWARGITLFPNDSALAAAIARANAAPPPTDSIAAIPMMRITARADRAPSEPPKPSIQEVTRGEILTTAGGTADVFSAVQVQPGATLVGEGSSVYTRGGDAGETATILNGARVLSLDRFEGLNGGMFGALEPWVVKSLRYSTGAFSVQHGNALSGIVDIETDGKPRERRSRAGLSLVQASGTAWLPAGKKAGGWVSARVSNTAALLATHKRTAEFDGSPHSAEMIGSVIATPTPDAAINATALISRDRSSRIVDAAGWRGPFASTGASNALMLNAKWQAAERLTLRGNVSAATRSTDFGFGVLQRERDDRSAAARVDAQYGMGMGMGMGTVELRGGVIQGGYDRTERGVLPLSPSVAAGAPSRPADEERSSTNERGAYLESEMARGGTALTLGARADKLPGETETTLDPRATLAHRSGNWTTRVGGGVFHQGRWRADAAIPDAGKPSGIPGVARHLVAGVEHERGGKTVRAEAYRKQYREYRTFGPGPQIASTDVRGLDLVAEHRTSAAVTGWVAYSMLDAESQLVDGRRVRSPFDVTHTASASATWTVGDWSLGSTARYGTGVPTTPVIGATADRNGFPVPAYGSPNSERLPQYARFDARVMRFVRLSSMLVTSFAEVINVTGRENVSGVTYDGRWMNREYMPTFFARRTIVIGSEVQFR